MFGAMGRGVPRLGVVVVRCQVSEGRSMASSATLQGRMPTTPVEEVKERRERKLVDLYRRLNTWPSQAALTSHLFDNIVYHDPAADKHGLVLLNKPHGLPLHPVADSAYSLSSSLKELADLLQVKELRVVRAAERWNSGLTVLGTAEGTAERYRRCQQTMRGERLFPTSYLCLTKGHSSLSKTESVSLRLVDCPQVANPVVGKVHREPEISRRLVSRHQGAREGSRTVHLHCSTVANSSRAGAALVEVQPSSTGKAVLQVYLADLGHAVLGDTMYDYRARTVMGHRVKLTTSHTLAERTQVLPAAMLEVLGVARGGEWEVPRMVHLHRLHLAHWLGKDTHLTVFAPLPPHLALTCRALGIPADTRQLAERDQLRTWAKSKFNTKKKLKKQQLLQQAQQTIDSGPMPS